MGLFPKPALNGNDWFSWLISALGFLIGGGMYGPVVGWVSVSDGVRRGAATYGPPLPRLVTRERSARWVGSFSSSPRAGSLGHSMPCMMIGVPSGHIMLDVAVRSELCFFGRADAVTVAAPKTRTARARVPILNNGPLISET